MAIFAVDPSLFLTHTHTHILQVIPSPIASSSHVAHVAAYLWFQNNYPLVGYQVTNLLLLKVLSITDGILVPFSSICFLSISFVRSYFPIKKLHLFDTHLLVQEKQRGSLRACTVEAPWIPPTLAKFCNIGIVVGLKIPLILDALLLLTFRMMTDAVARSSIFTRVTGKLFAAI